MEDQVPESWRAVLAPVLQGGDAKLLTQWIEQQEDAGTTVYPPRGQRLRALELTPLEGVKVVILGQDPYHRPGQAHGLAFSVPPGVRAPPSLANIFKELRDDCGLEPPPSGDLERWARQGVLLLNSCLTVEGGCAGSHAGKGWEAITDAIVAAVAERPDPSVFILWGNHAKAKALRLPQLANSERHLVLTSPHPSPLSAYAGFFGSKPFSRANAFLEAHGRGAIDW
jgi:uracil-DNA glycosylase